MIISLEVIVLRKLIDDSVFKKFSISVLFRVGDLNFVLEFYSNFRLYYLLIWGVEFKKYISDIIKFCVVKGWKSRGFGRVGSYGRVIMYIDMDLFFVFVILRD